MGKRKKDLKPRRRKKILMDVHGSSSKSDHGSCRISDPSGRGFPPASKRRRIIDALRSIPVEDRDASQSYQLGSLLVYEACLEDDDDCLNEGNEALVLAAEADPPIPDAILDLTWLLNLRGLPAMALRYAKLASELLPNQADAWRFRANTHLQLKQTSEAIECLRKAVALPFSTKSDSELLKKIERDPTKVGGRGVLGLPASFVQPQLDEDSETSDEQIKIQLFYDRQLLSQIPDDPGILFRVALGNYHLRKFKDAERYLAQLYTLDGDHANGLCMQGLINRKKNNLQNAREYFEKTLLADPSHLLGSTNLAKILLDEDGKTNLAQHILEVALETADESHHEYPNAISMYGHTVGATEKDYQRESEYHLKAIQLAPQQPNFRLSYILSILQAGDFQQLRKAWKKNQHTLELWSRSGFDAPPLKLALFLVPTVLNPPADFVECVEIAITCGDMLGGSAVKPLLYKAWDLRTQFRSGMDRFTALMRLGTAAGNLHLNELALRVFKEAEKQEENRGDATLNVAVTLGDLGRHSEAIKLALSVDPGLDRATTIQANLLRNAGKYEEALQKYLIAIESDPDFFLPVSGGISVASSLGDIKALERFSLVAQQNFDSDYRVQHAYAKARLAAGFPSEAASSLISILYHDGTPRGLPESATQSERDITVGDGPTENEMFFTLALALLKSRQFDHLHQLVEWMVQEREIHGNWRILSAESYRYVGEYQSALEIIEGMNIQPPPLITKALIHTANGEWRTVREAANDVLSKQFKDQLFFHPEGNPASLAYAVKSLNLSAEGYPQEAIEEGIRAVKSDCTCGVAHTSLAKAYEVAGEIEHGIEAGFKGLSKVPGDPGLLEWLVMQLVEQNDATRAREVLDAHRKSLESRGISELGWWLGEQVALAQLAEQPNSAKKIDAEWVSSLEPQSVRWLNAAVAGSERISDLRLGVAIYYCKIMERELTSKLVQPFVDSKPKINKSQFDNELKGLQDAFLGGRMPGLGSIAHSLRVAFKSTKQSPSALMVSWRTYLRGLPEPQRSAARDRKFIETLQVMARVRNRIAHLGDLTEAEFERVQNAVIDQGDAGLVLRIAGIS